MPRPSAVADLKKIISHDRFTAADLTFAALSAAVVLPTKYGVELPKLEELPDHMRPRIQEMREHPAGQFALRMFETERPQPTTVAPQMQGALAQ